VLEHVAGEAIGALQVIENDQSWSRPHQLGQRRRGGLDGPKAQGGPLVIGDGGLRRRVPPLGKRCVWMPVAGGQLRGEPAYCMSPGPRRGSA
jgi:hypothetical protein